ncbi:MAG TPA: hypothetical protein PLV92_24400, partial [Pirellulaceae bacterium]|nr:hypothetical protein [Pirellulaceae bacterium]
MTETLGPLTLVGDTASTLRIDYAGAAGQSLTFSGATALTRWAGSTLSLISNSDFAPGVNSIVFAGATPSLVGGIWPFATVTTNSGSASEAIDLVTDRDGTLGGVSVSVGRLLTYDSSNVKATSSLTLGSSLNALLISGDGVTVTVPAGGTTIASGQVVATGGNSSGNSLVGGAISFGSSEQQWFVQGANETQQLSLTGATGGSFALSLPFAGATSAAQLAVLGATGALAQIPRTIELAWNATASQIQAALEALPNIGAGNVVVTGAAGLFLITFVGSLAGGQLPRLNAANWLNSGAGISLTTSSDGGGQLLVSSAVGGTGAARKERRGKLVLAGDNSAFDSALAIASGVVTLQHSNALGDATANGATTVSSGAALELEGGISVAANESLTLSGLGYGNDGSGALRNRFGANAWNGLISLGSSVAAIGVGANSDGLYASPSSGSSDVLSLS